jgi:hypothetical protein
MPGQPVVCDMFSHSGLGRRSWEKPGAIVEGTGGGDGSRQ